MNPITIVPTFFKAARQHGIYQTIMELTRYTILANNDNKTIRVITAGGLHPYRIQYRTNVTG
jgi:hypothetical protein